MYSGLRPLSAVLCVALGLAACHRTHLVSTEELTKLDGWETGAEVTLLDIGRQEVKFDQTSDLALVTSDGTGPAYHYTSIRVEGREFVGVNQDGETVRVALDNVQRAVVGVIYHPAVMERGVIISPGVLFGGILVLVVVPLLFLLGISGSNVDGP